MQQTIFNNNFYWRFQVANREQLDARINSIKPGRGGKFTWGSNCEVDKKLLDSSEWVDVLSPTMEKFSHIIEKQFEWQISESWLNFYKKGYFQEVHCHFDCDLVAVYFPQTPKEGYSKFFFYDRTDYNLSTPLIKLLNTVNNWYPAFEGGDILIFPAHMLHGVTPHKHGDIRTSLSINIKIRSL